MIIVRLIGGMGNQMFQYATARRLSLKHDTVLKLDLRDFETYKVHKYALDKFNIEAEIANSEELAQFKPLSHTLPHRLTRKILSIKPATHYILEPHFYFAPEILGLPDNVYLDGYWQSEKYFIDYSNKITHELTIEPTVSGKNKDLIKEIENSNAVALHIRRGDYVSNKTAQKILGTQPLSYYETAVEYLLDRAIINPHFYIFSDDPAWVKTHLQLNYPATYVTHNDPDHGYEDLRLMTYCKHYIIANSSFSWWGAWLSHNKDKIVIAPRVWFAGNTYTSIDLIPNNWIQL